jgi:hypothetical protein
MKQPTFNIYVMSNERSDAIITKDVFEYCTYVVRADQEEEYRNSGIEDILVIPNGAVSDFMTTLYWIIENTPEDVLFIADDDIESLIYRTNQNFPIVTTNGLPDKEKSTAEVERIAQMLFDLNLGLAFDPAIPTPYAYDKEFRFIGMPGHMRWINKSAFKAKLDVNDIATSDIDMAMQELLYNRILLIPNYLCAKSEMNVNKGNVEDYQQHKDLQLAMKAKWRKHYDFNFTRNISNINVKRF